MKASMLTQVQFDRELDIARGEECGSIERLKRENFQLCDARQTQLRMTIEAAFDRTPGLAFVTVTFDIPVKTHTVQLAFEDGMLVQFAGIYERTSPQAWYPDYMTRQAQMTPEHTACVGMLLRGGWDRIDAQEMKVIFGWHPGDAMRLNFSRKQVEEGVLNAWIESPY